MLPESEVPPFEEVFAQFLHYAEIVGRRTAEMHLALATPTEDQAFGLERLTASDLQSVADDAHAFAERSFAGLRRLLGAGRDGVLAELLGQEERCLSVLQGLVGEPSGAAKIRVHGDYHLGQLLIVKDDVVIVDFEGEPARPSEERRTKSSPLRDVAGMLRSFSYASDTVARDIEQRLPDAAARAKAASQHFCRLASHHFLSAYEETVNGTPLWIESAEERARLLRLHLLSKALYEIAYEADNRPDWIETPVRGVLELLEEETAL
jgi:maltose alpha-D-glucosyltransferase/alpha-amylase